MLGAAETSIRGLGTIQIRVDDQDLEPGFRGDWWGRSAYNHCVAKMRAFVKCSRARDLNLKLCGGITIQSIRHDSEPRPKLA